MFGNQEVVNFDYKNQDDESNSQVLSHDTLFQSDSGFDKSAEPKLRKFKETFTSSSDNNSLTVPHTKNMLGQLNKGLVTQKEEVKGHALGMLFVNSFAKTKTDRDGEPDSL